jgi:hypothetical protein
MKASLTVRRLALIVSIASAIVVLGGAAGVVQGTCGPFTDVSASFCPYVLELYYLGITAGTSATTYSPGDPLTRGQGAVFVAKAFDQTLARSSRRAALGQWWTTSAADSYGLTTVGSVPVDCGSDGSDVWVMNRGDGSVSRVRASDGRLLETWTGASDGRDVLVAMGRVFTVGNNSLFMLDPSQPAGAVTTVATNLGVGATALAFDGSRIWTANIGSGGGGNGPAGGSGSVSIVTPGPTIPWSVTTVTGIGVVTGLVFDGSNVWVTDYLESSLKRLDANGVVLQSIGMPIPGAITPVFDGVNIWIPGGTVVTVVRASDGKILASLSGNGINRAVAAAFDGRRILLPNAIEGSVSLWDAASLAPLGSFPLPPAFPEGVCSDGLNFWIALSSGTGTDKLARF